MNIQTLGIMRRAGALEIGQDRALEAAGHHRAKLLLLPSDTPDRCRKNAGFVAEGQKNLKVIPLPWTNEELSSVLGVGSCNILAVTDAGFAKSISKELGGE